LIRDIILACGCKVELTIIKPALIQVVEDMPIQGVLTYPCADHAPPPKLHIPVEKNLITGLN